VLLTVYLHHATSRDDEVNLVIALVRMVTNAGTWIED